MADRGKGKKKNKKDAAQAAPAATVAAVEAAAAAARRKGLGMMLAVVLAAPALSAGMAGDMSARDLGVRFLAALVVGRLAVEFVARAVSPRPRRDTPAPSPMPPAHWSRAGEDTDAAPTVVAGSSGAPTGSR
jgi:hypothetical protein